MAEGIETRKHDGRWSVFGKISRRSLLRFGMRAAGGFGVFLATFDRSLFSFAGFKSSTSAAAAARVLEDDRLNTLVAFAHVLIPSSFATKPPADVVIREVLRDRAATELGTAADFLDAQSQAASNRTFIDLDFQGRCKLVEGILKPYTTRSLLSSAYYHLTEEGRRTRDLWELVAAPIIAGFYNSSLGWEVVGYLRRPGECSNLTEYQFPPT